MVKFLESTRVGCRTATRVLGPREVDRGARLLGTRERNGGRPSLGLYFSYVSFLCHLSLFFCPFLCQAEGEQETRVPQVDPWWFGTADRSFIKAAVACRGSGIWMQEYTHGRQTATSEFVVATAVSNILCYLP